MRNEKEKKRKDEVSQPLLDHSGPRRQARACAGEMDRLLESFKLSLAMLPN